MRKVVKYYNADIRNEVEKNRLKLIQKLMLNTTFIAVEINICLQGWQQTASSYLSIEKDESGTKCLICIKNRKKIENIEWSVEKQIDQKIFKGREICGGYLTNEEEDVIKIYLLKYSSMKNIKHMKAVRDFIAWEKKYEKNILYRIYSKNLLEIKINENNINYNSCRGNNDIIRD